MVWEPNDRIVKSRSRIMVSVTVQSLSRNHLTCQLIGWTQLMISYYLARLSHFQVDLNLFDWNCCDRLEVNDLNVTQHARIYHCRVYTCLPSMPTTTWATIQDISGPNKPPWVTMAQMSKDSRPLRRPNNDYCVRHWLCLNVFKCV